MSFDRKVFASTGKMASRNVVDTLDLCTTLGIQTDSPTSSQGIGWLSPRISFSTGFVDKSAVAEVEILDGCIRDHPWNEDRALDFEFCMAASSVDPVSYDCMLPADELFHKGKLLPQCLPPVFPRQEKLSVSLSGPLESHITPSITVASPGKRAANICGSLAGPCQRQATPTASFSGPLHRQDRRFHRFSGPLERQGNPCVGFSGPLRMESPTASIPVSSLQSAALRTPKSPKWEKVFGLLRRARSDSHRGRLCTEKENSTPPTKASPPTQKNQTSTANSLRLIFRRSSSIEKNVKPPAAVHIGQPCVNCVVSSPSVENPSISSPLHSSAPVLSGPAPVLHGPPTLSVLHVASPVYPTTTPSELDEGIDEDRWSSSATDVDLRPSSFRDSWRLTETEDSLDITFDKFDKINAKRRMDRGSGGICPATTNSAQIVLKNLERCSAPSGKGGKGQEHLRALRTREIRRSPERLASYSSSVRVTPVLNVPVCIGPALRSSKSAKGRLASLRALLSFKKEKVEKVSSGPAMAA